MNVTAAARRSHRGWKCLNVEKDEESRSILCSDNGGGAQVETGWPHQKLIKILLLLLSSSILLPGQIEKKENKVADDDRRRSCRPDIEGRAIQISSAFFTS